MNAEQIVNLFITIYMNSWWLMLIIFFSVLVGCIVDNHNRYNNFGHSPQGKIDDLFGDVMVSFAFAAFWPIPLLVFSIVGLRLFLISTYHKMVLVVKALKTK